MKLLLGIYSVFIFLCYTASFTLSGDFLNGVYITPNILLATIFLLAACYVDIRYAKDDESKGKKYFSTLLYMNIPLIILSFILPLINGNKTTEQLFSASLFITLGQVILLFFTVPILGFFVGTIYDFFKGQEHVVNM